MEKEIIELIKHIAGDATTVLLWYFALDAFKFVIGWVGAGFIMYWTARGFRAFVDAVQ